MIRFSPQKCLNKQSLGAINKMTMITKTIVTFSGTTASCRPPTRYLVTSPSSRTARLRCPSPGTGQICRRKVSKICPSNRSSGWKQETTKEDRLCRNRCMQTTTKGKTKPFWVEFILLSTEQKESWKNTKPSIWCN